MNPKNEKFTQLFEINLQSETKLQYKIENHNMRGAMAGITKKSCVDLFSLLSLKKTVLEG